ncbi:MAG: alkaline phosphatase family protein [Streptosporangiaceae bacterium]|nr:alkaline phosphatase family protein [Streptosporangiaceae bacterium]MBV9857347.1 alkaline phosphatase family protein [Streptosporangiaceae bacterium]
MRTGPIRRAGAAVASATVVLGSAALASAATGHPALATHDHSALATHDDSSIKHVLLISVDGLHQQDLAWYVRAFPNSVLAKLERHGLEYSGAITPFPSDSSPGMTGQVTGGDPRVTGVYYDDTWNHDVFPAGTTNCSGPAPGGEAAYEEALDKNSNSLDAGQGLTGLPGSILRMTGDPLDVLNPAAMPVNAKTCKPVYPNQYLKVNTIFNVARDHGLRTAWSDKHPAYQMFDGPSGNGVQDFFTPEINSQATGYPAGKDWTSDNAATMRYDSYKVRAILNEIDGYDHSRAHHVGVPAIFGTNFQTVSTAQKLPTSDGLTGGYLPGGTVPGPLLVRALNYINTEVAAMVSEIHARGLASSTVLILSAKHGQSPTDPATLARVPDGPIIGAINAAWKAAHPGAGDLVIFSTDDDGMLLWLSDRSQAAAGFVKRYLLMHSAAGNNISGNPVTVPESGLKKVYAGEASADFFGVPASEPRHPDILGIAQHGVVYTGGKGKIAEHGGDDQQDRNVPILVVLPGLEHGRAIDAPVETTQIAPTILKLLGLNPRDLQAVRIEHTRVLPGIGEGAGR